MSLIKIDPFRGFDTAVRRLSDVFDDINNGGIRFEIGEFTPRVDVADTEKELSFHVELPGLSKEDVKIVISDENVLTISGEKKRELKTEDKKYMRLERSYGSFARTFSLPQNLDTGSVNASFEAGILKITIPKLEPAKPRQQEINIQ